MSGATKESEIAVRSASEQEAATLQQRAEKFWGHDDIRTFGRQVWLSDCQWTGAWRGPQILGSAAFRIEAPDLLVVAVDVDRDHRSTGIGTALMAHLEEMAKEQGVERILLSTTNDNLPAIAFYQKRGYRLMEVLPGEAARALSDLFPEGLKGHRGLPIRDEFRFCFDLKSDGDSSDPIPVRRGGPEDLKLLLQITRDALGSDRADALVTRLSGQSLILIASRAGEPAGFLLSDESLFNHRMVRLVMVRRDHRRHGVARTLYAVVEAHCPTGRLFSSTEVSNLASRKMHEALGFQPSGQLDNLEQGEAELFYFKSLGCGGDGESPGL